MTNLETYAFIFEMVAVTIICYGIFKKEKQ